MIKDHAVMRRPGVAWGNMTESGLSRLEGVLTLASEPTHSEGWVLGRLNVYMIRCLSRRGCVSASSVEPMKKKI